MRLQEGFLEPSLRQPPALHDPKLRQVKAELLLGLPLMYLNSPENPTQS